jgi:aminopeptidase N
MRRPVARAAAWVVWAGAWATHASAQTSSPRGAPPVSLPIHVVTPDSATVARVRAALDSDEWNRVPPFRTAPLVRWGPLPPGMTHAERTPGYHIQHQIVRVRFDWARHAVVGSTTLRVVPLAGTTPGSVTLDAVGMTIRAVGALLRTTYDGQTLIVRVPPPARPGAAATFTVAYETVAPKKGAYFIDRRHVVWTQGEAEDTRYWVPTYDYPNDKTTWEFFIRVAAGEKALSNGRLVGTRPVAHGDVEWHWSLDAPASTYCMTVTTGDYAVLHDRWNAVPIDYWVYPDSQAAGWRGFGATPRAMAIFSARTGLAYPWVKYDQVVVPDFIFGGMENVTATTQNDNGILHPAWAEPQANADGLVAHELAHQWFGDYVTTRSWAHVWLNEGFATFMEQIFRETAYGPDEGALDRLEAQEEALAADARAARPIVYDRWETSPMEVFFSGHVYPKGATVLQMLRHQVGDSVFWTAIHRYLVKHAHGSVATDDLEQAIAEATRKSWADFFIQWVYRSGYPVFRIAQSYDTAARTLTLTARQVQPLDSLIGYFEGPVDVEVLTDSGAVRGVAQVAGPVSTVSLRLPAPPRSIRWDKGKWMLQQFDFPRSTAMLAYQLAHDTDPLGRIEAIDLLGPRAYHQRLALAAITAALAHDAVWGVRQRAVRALARMPGDSAAGAALLAAAADSDARVRQAAAVGLAGFRGPPAVDRLRALAADSSRFVRAAALLALVKTDTAAARMAADAALEHPSWRDVESKAARAALDSLRR